jgi:sugar phosphate isomerase/epimerase
MAWLLSAFTDEAGDSCEAQIEAAQKNGLTRLDLRGMDGFNCTTMPLDHARGVAQKLNDAGLGVGMFGSPIGKIDIADSVQTDVAKLEHLAELAPILGCRSVRIFSYYNKENRPHDFWQLESLSRLELLKNRAKQLGMVLYHENERHIYGDLCADVLQIAQLRDKETFKMIFDFDNYNQSGEDVWENWTKLGDLTDAIHLKDSTESNEHVPAGQGNGRIREILTDAKARGWNGPVIVEPHLSHSGAVAATGPSGVANQAFSAMAPHESFKVALDAAHQLLKEIGAEVG